MKQNKILRNLLYALQGAIVGVGAILPGVSGGVLCVAFGIYEPMMELFTHPIQSFKKNYRLFIPFVLGWFAGFLLLAKAVELLFAAAPTVALMLFFGLICGTLPALFKSSEHSNPKQSWTPFVVALALAYLFFHILENSVSTTVPTSFWSYLLCGLVWGLSLIIPGLSSSSVLIYLGLYEPMTAGIGNFDFGVLLPLILGVAVTVLSLARLVNKLFDKHYAVMSRIILGFVIASSLKIVPADFKNPLTLLLSLACFGLGFVIAWGMDHFKQQKSS